MSARYQAYLKSPHWRRLRARILHRDGYTCTDCGAGQKLQVHHLCYRPNLEDALDADLVTLCEDCHEKIHRKRVVRPAVQVVHFGHMAEKRWALLMGDLPIPDRRPGLMQWLFGMLRR